MAAFVGVRLLKHTAVAGVLLGSTILAPLLLLLLHLLGSNNEFGFIIGLSFLAAGSASFLGAALCRAIDRGACNPMQWKLMVASVWILNPVVVTIAGMLLGNKELTWWSAIPLAVALSALSGRLRLTEGDPDWVAEGCPLSFSLITHWFFSRLIFIGVPMTFLSLQVDLYLPFADMLPPFAVIGLFVCGGCIIISMKFCGMCACLATQKFAQALVLVCLLSSDWVSTLHIMTLVSDHAKVTFLLSFGLIAGSVQTRSALKRLCLRQRWKRALAQRQARQVAAGTGMDIELGASAGVVGGGLESSDSDDDRGPRGLPDSFHEALVVLMGVQPASHHNHTRQFLCGIRMATLPGSGTEGPETGISLQGIVPSEGTQQPASESALSETTAETSGSTSSSPGSEVTFTAEQLEIPADERVCVVCQDEIKPGDRVRPLPKCSHVFHAACLEHWARTMREATRCPTCRRPALARKEGKGGTKITELVEETSTSSERAASNSSTAGRANRARPPAGQRPRPSQRASHASQVSALRLTLRISEQLAQAALEVGGGGAAVAAHLVMEHRGVLDSSFSHAGSVAVPQGVAEAIVEASPSLGGADTQLKHQLTSLYQSGRIRRTSWADLTAAGQKEVLKALLEDVSRHLEQQ